VSQDAGASQLEIDIEAANELLKVGTACLIDVREEWERRRRRVPGAALIPLNSLVERTVSLPRGKQILVICEHGNRSLVAAQYLRSRGFEGAASVRGGTEAWARSGLPVDNGQAG
jgi:rhodanese-related sulfurtransferase